MTQEEWQALLPFYVSGQISDAERAVVEQSLRESAECRRALKEWRRIAAVLQSSTMDSAMKLPPLSANVRHSVRTSATQPNLKTVNAQIPLPTVPIRAVRTAPISVEKQAWRIPIAMVASFLFAILIGGLLIVLMQASKPLDQFGASVSATSQGTKSLSTDSDLGILGTVEPTVTVVQVWATNTPIPPALQTTGLAEGCYVSSATGQLVRIYDAPDTTSSIVGDLNIGVTRMVSVFDPTGWYEILDPTGGIAGWVRAIEVEPIGDSCQDVPRPTPLMPTPDPSEVCTISFADSMSITLYMYPSRESEVVKQISDLSTTYVLSQNIDGQWYRVRYDEVGATWAGYIHIEDAQFSSECENLPRVKLEGTPFPTAIYREPTPVPLPSLQSFSVDDTAVAEAGSAIRLTWAVQNSPQVTIEFYAPDVAESDYGVVKPISSSNNLLPEGSLDVVIPVNYAYTDAVFVLAMSVYGSDERGPISILRVPVMSSSAN